MGPILEDSAKQLIFRTNVIYVHWYRFPTAKSDTIGYCLNPTVEHLNVADIMPVAICETPMHSSITIPGSKRAACRLPFGLARLANQYLRRFASNPIQFLGQWTHYE